MPIGDYHGQYPNACQYMRRRFCCHMNPWNVHDVSNLDLDSFLKKYQLFSNSFSFFFPEGETVIPESDMSSNRNRIANEAPVRVCSNQPSTLASQALMLRSDCVFTWTWHTTMHTRIAAHSLLVPRARDFISGISLSTRSSFFSSIRSDVQSCSSPVAAACSARSFTVVLW